MRAEIVKAFEDESIIEPRQFVSEYTFRLRELSRTKIAIRIYREPDGRFYFEQSHYIHTPLQASAYTTSIQWTDSEEGALRSAIDTITSYYRQAIEEGHKPSPDWLEPDEDFFHPNSD
jgi:hypothetical protein